MSLERRKPLKRTAMKRKAPKVANRGKPRHAWTGISRAPAKAHPWPAKVEAAIRARSGGACEARLTAECRGVGQHLHHRKLRGQGGPETIVNGLHVCFLCHHAAHTILYGRAVLRGIIVRSWVANDEIPPYVPFSVTP